MLKQIWFASIAGVFTTLLFPFTVTSVLLTGNPRAGMWWIQKVWAPFLLWFGRVRLVVEGLEQVRPGEPAIFISNHQSTVDMPALLVILPDNVRFMAKRQIQFIPFVGLAMMACGFIFVDRGNRRRAARSVDLAAQRIREGRSIIVFPEGTRSPDGAIYPFKNGAFALAEKARVPIYPIAIEGSARVMPKNTWNISGGEVRILIGAPISPETFPPTRADLAKLVRARVVAQARQLGGQGDAT